MTRPTCCGVRPENLGGWLAPGKPIVVVTAAGSAPFCQDLVGGGFAVAAIGMRSGMPVSDAGLFTGEFYGDLLSRLVASADATGALDLDLPAEVMRSRPVLRSAGTGETAWLSPAVYAPVEPLAVRATAEAPAPSDRFTRATVISSAAVLRRTSPARDRPPPYLGPGAYEELTEIMVTAPQTLSEVRARIRRIVPVLDRLPPAPGQNRVAAHNAVRIVVTERLHTALRSSAANPEYLEALAVEWHRAYFEALVFGSSRLPVPECWRSLFSRAEDRGLRHRDAVMIGMNAALNHDLPLALVRTWQRLGRPVTDTPDRDYLLLRRTVKNETPELMPAAARAAQRLNEPQFQALDGWTRHVLADVTAGRAWDQALRMWPLRQSQGDFGIARDGVDSATAKLSELLV